MDKRFGLKENCIKNIVNVLRLQPEVEEAIIFGSRAMGTYKNGSDIDIALKGENITFDAISTIRLRLDELPYLYMYDIIDYKKISNPAVTAHIDELGITFYKKQTMPSEWKTCKLGEIADIIMGQSPSGETCNSEGSGIPLLNGPTEFGTFTPTPVQFTTDPKKMSEIDDILFCVRGSTTGRMNWSNKKYAIGRGLAAIRHKKGEEYKYFLKGLIDFNLNRLLGNATGSTFPNISGSQLKDFEITAPPLSIQTQIAQILSSLDDKIELNLQMNQTLEAMAQAIFKEWFVDFNFPNSLNCDSDDLLDDCDIKKSGKSSNQKNHSSDNLPKGWRMGKVKEMYRTTSGGTPSRAKEEYYENGTINWVKSKELNGSFIFDTEERITIDAIKNSSAKLIPKHSILVAMYGATVGEYAITSRETTCNQAICAVIENGSYPFTYFFEYFKNNKFNIIGQASGSAQQNISQALIQQLDILIPPIEVVKKYHSVVESMFTKMENNLLQNQTLTQLRDTLLPKLMSGSLNLDLFDLGDDFDEVEGKSRKSNNHKNQSSDN